MLHQQQNYLRVRIIFTVVITTAMIAMLAWEHFHGGVVSHHILHRPDMPAISNWWGLIVFPVLTWFLLARSVQRIITTLNSVNAVIAGFVISLIAGIALSVAFSLALEDAPFYILMGILLIAVILPIYRAECVLGFVIGMTFTFGAIIPTAIASIIAALSAVIHAAIVRPLRRY